MNKNTKNIQTKPNKESAKKTVPKQHLINYLLIGVLIGFLLFAAIRLVTYKPETHTHYHANWSVWLNSQQQTFSEPTNYQEIMSCSNYEDGDPAHRAHMHDQVYDIIHVHADGVTYNQYLENLGAAALPNYLKIGGKEFTNTAEGKITYILNGKQVDSLSGLVIGSEDKLLINYGNEPISEIMTRYNQIQNKAKEYNSKPDPTTCSGAQESTWQDRFKHILF